jgi:hypothetical protein
MLTAPGLSWQALEFKLKLALEFKLKLALEFKLKLALEFKLQRVRARGWTGAPDKLKLELQRTLKRELQPWANKP